ncbi:MAG: hypothetical protein LBV40_00020 [Methanomicrobiales archaeon]|nr:hypothetical protein [Methanomicrobiales archaeon]
MVTHIDKHWNMVGVYSATHFFVDFACAFLMFRSIAGTPESYLCVLFYNFCAFAMQMPLGIIADKINRNSFFAIFGCVLVGLAYGFVHIPIAAVIIIGIGNAMFHIGGGIDVLNISDKKLAPLGIFVAPGAFGIYYGAMLGKGSDLSAIFIPLALIAVAALIFISYRAQRETYPKNATFSLDGIHSLHIPIAISCLFCVVFLRSFVGLELDFPWKGIGYFGTVLVCAVVFGKIIGGFAADRFGVAKTSFFSLGIATTLFLFPMIPLAGATAVLLFNMTMPITLWALVKTLPGAKGFAFGLLTFGLFLGFLPKYLNVEILTETSFLVAVLAAGSLVLLLVGIRMAKL